LEELPSVDFVANSTYLSPSFNTSVVTGPNGGGKSTYLRQVAVLVILAKSIFEQAREEKEAEIKAKAKAAELDDEENERKEPTGEFASTISALDRLTAAIDEKLEAKDKSQKK
jgi:dsDNA-specific endonuclease/ATPase MutS2